MRHGRAQEETEHKQHKTPSAPRLFVMPLASPVEGRSAPVLDVPPVSELRALAQPLARILLWRDHSVLIILLLTDPGHGIAPALASWSARRKDLWTSDLHLCRNRMMFAD